MAGNAVYLVPSIRGECEVQTPSNRPIGWWFNNNLPRRMAANGVYSVLFFPTWVWHGLVMFSICTDSCNRWPALSVSAQIKQKCGQENNAFRQLLDHLYMRTPWDPKREYDLHCSRTHEYMHTDYHALSVCFLNIVCTFSSSSNNKSIKGLIKP